MIFIFLQILKKFKNFLILFNLHKNIFYIKSFIDHSLNHLLNFSAVALKNPDFD